MKNGSRSKTAVLLLAHGSPDNVDDIPEFLKNVTGGRPLPQNVVDEVKRRYGLIGRSRLPDYTKWQAEALAAELQVPVYWAMRNWTPYIADVARTMAADGVQRTIAICLAPQNSRTSVGLYRSALLDTQSKDGSVNRTPLEVDFVEYWHDHPLLVRAFADKLRSGWEQGCRELGAKLPVIFTAHSVPAQTVADGDPYERQARETATLVAKAVPDLSFNDWTFAFQSQGASVGPWLGPTVEETIRQLGEKGHRGVFIQPVGFLCDHVEVLYDIDIAFRQIAQKRGMRLWRAESLNDSPLLTSALAGLARSRLALPAESTPLVQTKH